MSARQPRAKLPDDEQLAQLQARHAARWEIWLVPGRPRSWWCIKPAGTPTGIHNEDTPDHLEAWIHRVDALTSAGITITFHHGSPPTATATWTSPGSNTPATYGPAPTGEVLDHAEDINARRTGLIQWLTRDPEGTARHMSDAQVEGYLPHIPDDDARRVLEAMVRQNAGRRREHYLAPSQPPAGPLAALPDDPGTAPDGTSPQETRQ
jgi:hypothetical protein